MNQHFKDTLPALLFIIALGALTLIASTWYSTAHAGSANLSWVAPNARTDDKILLPEEIAGYTIYHGIQLDKYTTSIRIDDNTANSHTVDNLPSGTHYFVITTRDTGGLESKYSPVVTKNIDAVPVKLPASPVFTVTRNGTGFEYTLNVNEVTRYADGTFMPAGAVNNMYLFDNNGWIKDIKNLSTPLTLTIGIHNFTMETQINTGAGNVVSKRSEVVTVDVQDYVAPVLPPNAPILIVVPEGQSVSISGGGMTVTVE